MIIRTFGMKGGNPPGATAVIDCRGLRNPHHVPALKRLTGLEHEVQEYVMADPAAEHVVCTIIERLTHQTGIVWVACYGGRHRSVAVAERAARRLRSRGNTVKVEHMALSSLQGGPRG